MLVLGKAFEESKPMRKPLYFLIPLCLLSACGTAQVGPAEKVDPRGSSQHLDNALGPGPYPFILEFGLGGSQSWQDSSGQTQEYFPGIQEALQANGEQVFIPNNVDAYNDSYTRGAEFLTFVQGVLQQTGAAKVNIIAHSQGGFEARYVANQIPNQVASVTTI